MNVHSLSLASIAKVLGGDITGGQVLAPGPGHKPVDRSMSIKLAPQLAEGFIVYSHAGDDWQACKEHVRQKLGLPGFEPSSTIDTMAARAAIPKKVVAEYVYKLADGTPYLKVQRYEPKDFRPFHMVDGRWRMGDPKGPRVPYRLPEMLANPAADVFMVEGEKDANRLARTGLVATTSSGGANRWSTDLAEHFRGRNVVILPDNDAAGHSYADDIARNLYGVAATVRIVNLPGLPEKGDVSNWLDAGGQVHLVVGDIGDTLDPAEDRSLVGLAKAAPTFNPAEPSPGLMPAAEPAHWISTCLRDERKRPLNILANVMIAMRSDPALKDIVAYDQMLCAATLRRPPPVFGEATMDGPFALRAVSDADVSAIQEFLQLSGLRKIYKDVVHQAVDLRAKENAFHPVRDYLQGLAWDGGKRLTNWLSTYLGVEATPYASGIGRMFMIAMVARIFEPGSKCDYMVVLEGAQGARKSTACAKLGGAWFSDNLPDVTAGKDVAQHLPGKWLIEIAEMSSMSRAESASLKAFITRPVERYRPSYGRREVVEPRQCVFIGTTNKSAYLRDETGGRRFWPVKVGTIDTDGLERDRDQLFAEAVAAYRDGARWWPDADFERQHIAPQQEERFEVDAWEDLIATYLSYKDEATLTDIATAESCLNMKAGQFNKAEQNRVVAVLERIGWKRGLKSHGRIKWVRASRG